MFALMVDLKDRLAVVVGGGAVGRRKARSLLDAGAIVRLACLEPQPPDFTAPRLVWLKEPYSPDHLAGSALVFAAAAPHVNSRVVADAKRRGIWVNSADDPVSGDFVVPATLTRGDLTIAVATSGAAPMLAQRLRDGLETHFDAAYADWVAILKELRPLAKATIADEFKRRDFFERVTDVKWLEFLRRDGRAAVCAAMLAELRRAARGVIE